VNELTPRCPGCGAHVRAGDQWCTLCYADLRAAAASPPAEPPQDGVGPPGSDDPVPHAADPAADAVEPDAPVAAVPGGRHARRAAQPPGPAGTASGGRTAVEEVDPDVLLVQLAADSGFALHGLAGHLDSPGAKVAVMAGGIVAVTLVMFLLMLVVGSLL
jgi:hypothetical protein